MGRKLTRVQRYEKDDGTIVKKHRRRTAKKKTSFLDRFL